MSSIGIPGSPTYSETLSGLGDILNTLEDNSSNDITARNIRDVSYTLYESIVSSAVLVNNGLTFSGGSYSVNLQTSKGLKFSSGKLVIDDTFYDNSNKKSIEIQSRSLDDTTGTQSLNWESRVAYDSYNYNSIDWSNRQLYNTSGQVTVDYQNTLLIDNSGSASIDWNHHFMFDANEFCTMDYSNLSGLMLIGDAMNNINGVKISIDNPEESMSFYGTYNSNLTDMFTMCYPNGEVIFGDYNNNRFRTYFNLDDLNQRIELYGLYSNVVSYYNFTGTGLNDFSTANCNSSETINFIFQIDSVNNNGYLFDSPTGTLNIGDVVQQTSAGSGFGVTAQYLGTNDSGFMVFMYVSGSTPWDILGVVQTLSSSWVATVNTVITDITDTFFYMDSLGNTSSFNLMPSYSSTIYNPTFAIDYQFGSTHGHTLGDYWEIQYSPSYGKYADFSNGKFNVHLGDIDQIFTGTQLRVGPRYNSVQIVGEDRTGSYENPSLIVDTFNHIVDIGDANRRFQQTKIRVSDISSEIFTTGFQNFSEFDSSFTGSLNDLKINKGANCYLPLNTDVYYTIVIDTIGYPQDHMTWSDNQGNTGGQLLDGNPITLSYGFEISFGVQTGHGTDDTWVIGINNNFGRSSYINGLQRRYLTGDVQEIGNSTWTKLDDRKSSYDINGLRGTVFTGVRPNVFGTTTMSEQLIGFGMTFFPFPVAFTGPAPTDYTVQIDSVGTPDTFAWQDNQGNSGSMIPITGSTQSLSYNVTITFSATTGAVLGDSWYFTYYEGASRMLSLNGAGNSLFPLGGYMQFGDVDGGVSGTQIMIIPEFKVMGIFGNMFNVQQDPTFPSFISEVTSGYPTFGNHHILSGLDGNAGTEASMAFGNSIGMISNDYWRIGANIFDVGDNSFAIATDNLGPVITIDAITGYLSIAFVPYYSDDSAAIGAGMINNQLYKNTTGGITTLCIVP